jgi:hypothetical protein
MTNQTIHSSDVKTLVGKTIKWSAPGYRANGNYSGVAKITGVKDERNPLVSETISGDNLEYAFVDEMSDGLLAYSDSYRIVTYEIVEDAASIATV